MSASKSDVEIKSWQLSNRALALWEIVSVVSSVLIAEWIIGATYGISRFVVAIPIMLALVLMIGSHRERRESARDIGLRVDNFGRAMLLLLAPMLIVSLLFVLIGWLSGTGISFLRWGSDRPLLLQLLLGVGWGFAQQYVLQGFINRRATMCFGRGWGSVILVAAIFAGLHLPNLRLICITFVGGVIWARIYQREPNLLALAISHSVMTWVVISTIPPTALHHLRIGFGYFL